MCVAAFPVPGCGSIKTDLLLCWIPLSLGNWLEVSISVFLFQWMAFTDLLSGPWEPFGAPWHLCHPTHGTFQPPVPSVLAPVRCHSPAQPWAPRGQVCSCPCQTLLRASVTFGVPWAAPSCPSLPHSLGGCWHSPWLVLLCSFAGVKQAVVWALPLHHKSISITGKKWKFCWLSLVFWTLPSHARFVL